MSEDQGLRLADLRTIFEAPKGRAEAVGMEVEVGLIDRTSRRNATSSQTAALLADIAATAGGMLLLEREQAIGVGLGDGAQFTLETGGALEYSSPPFPTVAGAVADVRAHLQLAAGLADRQGIALLTGGIVPFTAADGITWNPKPRVQIMRDYFERLGPDGAHADEVMGLVLSAQTSLDYMGEADLMDKLRLLVRASPVVAALFVDSPVAAGEPTGVMSRRMQYWRHFDPRRCGVLDVALDTGAGIDDLVDWAARLPMIYRVVGGQHVAAAPIPFREAVERGFGDGTYPIRADWELHLSQVWPHVRVRRTLELRLADAPPWPWFGAGAALWAGLAYDPGTRRAADGLLADLTAADVDRASAEVAVKGLTAMIGAHSVHDLARELLRLARQGLSARVAAGLEAPTTLALLEPVEEVCETRHSFADQALDSWEHGTDHFLAAFSIPAATP